MLPALAIVGFAAVCGAEKGRRLELGVGFSAARASERDMELPASEPQRLPTQLQHATYETDGNPATFGLDLLLRARVGGSRLGLFGGAFGTDGAWRVEGATGEPLDLAQPAPHGWRLGLSLGQELELSPAHPFFDLRLGIQSISAGVTSSRQTTTGDESTRNDWVFGKQHLLVEPAAGVSFDLPVLSSSVDMFVFGSVLGVRRLGAGLAVGFDIIPSVQRIDPRAEQRACLAGDAYACEMGAAPLDDEHASREQVEEAAILAARGCALGRPTICKTVESWLKHAAAQRLGPSSARVYERMCADGLMEACEVGIRVLATAADEPDWASVRRLGARYCLPARRVGLRVCAHYAHALERGLGGPSTPTLAVANYDAACAAGSTWACLAGARLIQKEHVGTPGQAHGMLRLACHKGDRQACGLVRRTSGETGGAP